MDYNMCSLEEEDNGDLFLTQVPSQKSCDNLIQSSGGTDGNEGKFLGVVADDFASPCKSLVRDNDYSDISEEDEFDCYPMSQGRGRYV